MSPVARLLDAMVAAYQRLFAGRPSPCRYVPSCSTYAREALAHHGAARGSWLTVRRLVRCAPWGSWGYDPVPGTDHAGHPEQPGQPAQPEQPGRAPDTSTTPLTRTS